MGLSSLQSSNNVPFLSLSDIEVQVVGLIKIIIDPESIMTESTAVCISVQ